jgi:hypothetical protein
MTSEKKASLIRNIFILLLVLGIPAIVFAPWKEKPKKKTPKAATETIQTETKAEGGSSEVVNFNSSSELKDGQIAEILAQAAKKRGGIVVGLIHYHVPGNPGSEQTADILNHIARRYGIQVKVIRVNIIACKEAAKAETIAVPPKVVFMAGDTRACDYDGRGLWTYPRVQQKVDELLHGLERVGKDWRPAVKGMEPAGKPANQ